MALTKEQKDLRRNYIGGSDSPIIVGASDFKTPIRLWLEKRGEIDPDLEEEESEAMFWGTRLEEVIAEVYSERTGKKVRRSQAIVSKEHPFMAVNVDRQILNDPRGPGYLECKNFGHWSGSAIQTEDDIHDYVKVQLQHGLAVTGWSWGAIAILIGGNRLFTAEMNRDEQLIHFLIEAEAEFWRMVQEGIQPQVDGHARTTEFFKRMFPKDNGETLTIHEQYISDLAVELDAVKQDIKTLEEQENGLTNTFKLLMKDNQILRLPAYGELWWKNQRPKPKEVFLEEEFKAKHPDLYAQFCQKITPQGHRVFTLHKGKDSSEVKEKTPRKLTKSTVAQLA